MGTSNPLKMKCHPRAPPRPPPQGKLVLLPHGGF